MSAISPSRSLTALFGVRPSSLPSSLQIIAASSSKGMYSSILPPTASWKLLRSLSIFIILALLPGSTNTASRVSFLSTTENSSKSRFSAREDPLFHLTCICPTSSTCSTVPLKPSFIRGSPSMCFSSTSVPLGYSLLTFSTFTNLYAHFLLLPDI